MPPRNRFLIVGMQRSGTTALLEAVGALEGVTTNYREAAPRLFYDGCGAYYHSRTDLFGDKGADTGDKPPASLRLFDLICELGTVSESERIRCLKVATGQHQEAKSMVDGILCDFDDLRIIHVKRNDVIAACASFHFARKSRVFHVYNWEDAPKPRFTLDREYLLNYMFNWFHINEELTRLADHRQTHTYIYERDILTGGFIQSNNLPRVLGLTGVRVRNLTLKKSLPDKSEMIENLSECEDLVGKVMPHLQDGMPYDELYRRHGPSLAGVVIRRAREARKHPATILRRSFWKTLKFKLGGRILDSTG